MTTIINIWLKELKNIFKDEGILIFLIIVPLGYPLLYSWIYNNEVVREVPVVVVDKSNSAESREFIRMCDASPDVNMAFKASSINEAKDIVAKQKAYGIIYFPEDYATKLNRMEQTNVSVYCDMSLMLAYKAIFQTSTTVSQKINTSIQLKLLGNKTNREDQISSSSLVVDDISIFNTTGGYGNFILPGVLVLIIQQTILLAIGMQVGTRRDRKRRDIIDKTFLTNHPVLDAAHATTGRLMAYFAIGIVTGSYVLLVVPRLFSFVSITYAMDFYIFLCAFLIAVICFAMATMQVIRQREDAMLIVVFTSVALLFLGGVSWPESSMPQLWKYVATVFPSTFGIKAFIKTNTMGAHLQDIRPEILCLCLQAIVYYIIACICRFHQLSNSKNSEKGIKEVKKGENNVSI